MNPRYIHIAGPCSAENREQVLLTARQLKEACGDASFIFRAGVWKPRTSPESFQGVGPDALRWLQEVKESLGIEVATEVATSDHVREALFAGIDYLWIGARTSANPIAVQAIANTVHEVKRKPKAVIVKNPVHEDAKLWLGNVARLEQAGVPVIAVHRGCNHQPCWAMAHALRQARPDIPLLIDPSHMSGQADHVKALLCKAAELGYNGWMVEVHCSPEQALSDAGQQLTPDQYRSIVGPISVQHRRIIEGNDGFATPLEWMRAEIDETDDRLWDTIARRMDISRRIGEWKRANGVQPLQPQRYNEILEHRRRWAEAHNLPAELVEQIFDAIHRESLKRQEQ